MLSYQETPQHICLVTLLLLSFPDSDEWLSPIPVAEESASFYSNCYQVAFQYLGTTTIIIIGKQSAGEQPDGWIMSTSFPMEPLNSSIPHSSWLPTLLWHFYKFNVQGFNQTSGFIRWCWLGMYTSHFSIHFGNWIIHIGGQQLYFIVFPLELMCWKHKETTSALACQTGVSQSLTWQ